MQVTSRLVIIKTSLILKQLQHGNHIPVIIQTTMNQFTKKKYFIGVDISKDHLDPAIVKKTGYGVFKDKKIANSFKGFGRIKSWLSQMDLDYCVEPAIQIKRSLGLTRGKNDKIDARRIAEYALTNRAFFKSLQTIERTRRNLSANAKPDNKTI